jgi:hypothetical protein
VVRRIVSGVFFGMAMCAVLGLVAGCNTPPVEASDPITRTDFITSIVTAASGELAIQCLPQRLTIDPETNRVACLIVGRFPSPPGSNGVPSHCEDVPGGAYITPDPTVIKEFHRDQHARWLQSGGPSSGIDPSTELTCEVQQLPPNKVCNASSSDNGWCYVETDGAPVGCAQEILFSETALMPGVVTILQCLELPSGLDGGLVTSSPTTPTTGGNGGGGH